MNFTASSRYHCDVCDGYQTVPADTVFERDRVCTCGAGPLDAMTVHDGECDTVSCPFCQLLDESVHQEV